MQYGDSLLAVGKDIRLCSVPCQDERCFNGQLGLADVPPSKLSRARDQVEALERPQRDVDVSRETVWCCLRIGGFFFWGGGERKKKNMVVS